ncbi:MAG: acetyl-CoA C-acyltransferase, partial [Rhizobiales bacterium]|nr:acetyl-CoA C-acyltransferase [Hyphomicrobiales bacterium]
MVDAVIVSTARTPIGKAYRGALNDTTGATLGAHAIREALKRSGVDAGEIEDVIMGCAMQEGTTGLNVARRALLTAGLPVTVAGTTIDRQCSSGLQSMALLANAIRNDGVKAGIAGGLESISLVQNDHRNTYKLRDEKLMGIKPDVYMPMIDTAEIVAKRYNISRERQDEYGLESQRRVAAAREAGRFEREIAPIDVTMAVVDKVTKEISHKKVTLAHDEGPRPDTTAEGLASLKPVREGGTITAGNASQ